MSATELERKSSTVDRINRLKLPIRAVPFSIHASATNAPANNGGPLHLYPGKPLAGLVGPSLLGPIPSEAPMNARSLIPRNLLVLAALPLLFPLSADAQRMGQPGAGIPVDPVAQALEHRDALELSADQLAALNGFQADAAARTAEARARVEAWRAEMETRREAVREQPQGERRQDRLTPDPELRDALRLLQEERLAARELLNSTLTVDQMRRLQAELRRDRGAMARMAPRSVRPGRDTGIRAPAARAPAARAPGARAPGVRTPVRAPARFQDAPARLQAAPAFRAGFQAGLRAGFRTAQRPVLQRRLLRDGRDVRMQRFERR
jgi:hypothetical protein